MGLAPSPALTLDDRPLSAVRDSLFHKPVIFVLDLTTHHALVIRNPFKTVAWQTFFRYRNIGGREERSPEVEPPKA
jgi:hypothetical protein